MLFINLSYYFLLYSIPDQKQIPFHTKQKHAIYMKQHDGKIHSKIVVDAFLTNTHSKIVVSGIGTGIGIRTGMLNNKQTFHSNKKGRATIPERLTADIF